MKTTNPPSPKGGSPVKNPSEALAEKEKGNEAYKQRRFSIALQHYDKAIERDPTNMTFLSNKAAVYFEQKDFDTCRELCLRAVEVGRKNKADYQLIAKAFARMGNSYAKENDLPAAVVHYNKSLAEHRTKEVVEKLRQCEKAIAEEERRAYINPDLALFEKEKGNELFKAGNYPEALERYTEAIKRDPDSAALHSNRAACYMKMLEFQSAVKDCDECIAKDPLFIKGHVRKGGALEAMKEYPRAIDAYQKALEIDPKNAEAGKGSRRCLINDYERRNNPDEVRKRAIADPEIGRILSDPAMHAILEKIEGDPNALLEHLKNPEIAKSIQKLIDAGYLTVK